MNPTQKSQVASAQNFTITITAAGVLHPGGGKTIHCESGLLSLSPHVLSFTCCYDAPGPQPLWDSGHPLGAVPYIRSALQSTNTLALHLPFEMRSHSAGEQSRWSHCMQAQAQGPPPSHTEATRAEMGPRIPTSLLFHPGLPRFKLSTFSPARGPETGFSFLLIQGNTGCFYHSVSILPFGQLPHPHFWRSWCHCCPGWARSLRSWARASPPYTVCSEHVTYVWKLRDCSLCITHPKGIMGWFLLWDFPGVLSTVLLEARNSYFA